MPHLLVLKTPKVVLPFTFCKTTEEQQSLIFENVDEVIAHDGGPMFLVTVYQHENRFADIGCWAEQMFYFSQNKGQMKFNCCKELTGTGRFSIRYLCFKPNINKDHYEGIYGLFLKPKEEDIRTNLQTEILNIMNLNKDDLLKRFDRQELVLKNLSFCIADKLFPGDNPKENEIRLTYLRERSENRRLRMLKKHLLSK